MCWAWSGDLKTVQSIKKWPKDRGGSVKVPTRIQYGVHSEPVAWGFEARESATTFEWFKLLLDYDSHDMPMDIKNSPRVQTARHMLEVWPPSEGNALRGAELVTRDYIQLLWRHVVHYILETKGQTWARNMACKVVVTRPAIWSQKASARTETAVKRAITGHSGEFRSVAISLVSEPEAAAHAVLRDPTVSKRPDLHNVSN